MDIVYPIKRTKDNKELVYSLRSLENIEYDNVFIIGELPNFQIFNIAFLPTQQFDSRYEATTNNIKVACQCSDLSEDFILMNDDFFFLQQTKIEELNLDRGSLKEQVQFYHKNHNPLTRYDRLVEQTYLYYKELGYSDPRSFELHCPMIINKKKFLSILPLFKSESLHCCKRTVYGNEFIKDSKTIEDVKILSNIVTKEDDWDKMKFISTSENMFKTVEPFLLKKFPNKSKFEII